MLGRLAVSALLREESQPRHQLGQHHRAVAWRRPARHGASGSRTRCRTRSAARGRSCCCITSTRAWRDSFSSRRSATFSSAFSLPFSPPLTYPLLTALISTVDRPLHSDQRRAVVDPGLCHRRNRGVGRRVAAARPAGAQRRRSHGQPDHAVLGAGRRQHCGIDFRQYFGYRLIFAALWFVMGVVAFTWLPC